MYAVILTGGKQYKVSEGDIIRVEKLDVKEGDKVTVKRMLEYAFETLKMDKVWCGAFVGNIRSIRVQEKCLFVYSHEEDVNVSPLDEYRTERFSYIVRDDWMNRK